MSRVLRSARKRKKVRTLGPVDIIRGGPTRHCVARAR